MVAKRGRAWRRAKARTKAKARSQLSTEAGRQKNWKLMYTRSAKLARAKQLGLEYPRRRPRHLVDDTTDRNL